MTYLYSCVIRTVLTISLTLHRFSFGFSFGYSALNLIRF